MTSMRLRFNLLASIGVLGLSMALSCAGQEDGGGDTGSGGSDATGGSNDSTGGMNGNGTGGTTATGGRVGTGGSVSTGGATATGGTTATGGHVGTGGATATGGHVGTGGATSTGGTTATGGHVGTGGVVGTGGATGGHVGTGGVVGTGGATGGHVGTGGSTGGSPGTGGATSTTCSGVTLAANGSGEFTYYWFGQGTAKGELGDYQTACGYMGTESGMTDTVTNISNTSPAKNSYFVAIPGDSGFSTSKYCGACVQLTNGGTSVIATVIDECPESSNPICQKDPSGELDVSYSAFVALGYNTSTDGNPQHTTWKMVPCPITGNVIVRVKQVNELYIENVILPIASVSGPGGNASRTSYGTWHFNSNITAGAQLTLTDFSGRTLTVTVSSTSADQNQDTGKQFPKCS